MMRLRAGVVLGALALAPLVSLPSASAAGRRLPQVSAAAVPAGHQAVYLQLANANQPEIERLARAGMLHPAERQRRFAAAMPSATTRARVQQLAVQAGLRLLPSSPFTVAAEGTPEQVQAFVGDRAAINRSLKAVRRGGAASRAATAAAADTIPSSLRGLVSAVTGGNQPGVRLRPLATNFWNPTFADINNRYGGVDGTPTSGTPLTIATLQLSGWDKSVLYQYAADKGLTIAPGQYTEINVSQDPTVADGSGGDQEVALDQETLLAMAPHANQRAYFVRNALGGSVFANAVSQVAAEAATYHIVALSISWGGCEATWSADEITAVNSAVAAANAAGVTVFAASGDSGKYDCWTSGTPALSDVGVDYPASDPGVIGVGGTTVLANGAESAWSDPSPGSRPWGSGGGSSTVFSRPAYQASITTDPKRQVPDISANADASSGPPVLLPDNSLAGASYYSGGGTSISAPEMAAMFTNTLAHLGWTSGVGDIHDMLYSQPTGGFADIVTGGGDAAWAASVGYDNATGLGTPRWSFLQGTYTDAPVMRVPMYVASTATATPIAIATNPHLSYGGFWLGLGTPPFIGTVASGACPAQGTASATPPASVSGLSEGLNTVWVTAQVTRSGVTSCYLEQGTITVDTVTPSAAVANNVALYPYTSGNTYTLSVSLNDVPLAPGGPTSGILRNEYRYRWIAANAASAPVSAWSAAGSMGTARTKNITVGSGRQYCFQVRSIDRAGNTSVWSAAKCVTVPYDDRSLTYTWGWTRNTVTGWMANTRTTTSGAYRTLTFPTTRVKQVGIIATRCASCGSVKVYVGTSLIGTINLRYTSTQNGVLFTFPRRSTALVGPIRLVTQSWHQVSIDALVLTGH